MLIHCKEGEMEKGYHSTKQKQRKKHQSTTQKKERKNPLERTIRGKETATQEKAADEVLASAKQSQ